MLIVTNTYTSGAAVSGKRLRVNGLNSEYIMRLFDPVGTNSITSGFVYASFIANANYVPSAGQGTYFATFNDVIPNSPPDGTSATNGFDFRGRVFEIGNTNAWPFTNTVSLTYRFGVANAAGDPAQGGGPSIVYVPIDLVKNVDYQVVLKYDIDNAVAYLWVNPASESDTRQHGRSDQRPRRRRQWPGRAALPPANGRGHGGHPRCRRRRLLCRCDDQSHPVRCWSPPTITP